MGAEWKIIEVVRTHIGCLFHVTDEANFPSIAQHGLLSKKEISEKGVLPKFPGGSDLTRALDGEYGLNDFVFLGFVRSTLMPAHKSERRRRRPRVLCIDPEVLALAGVRIALGRANHSRTRTYRAARAFYEMDWEAIAWCLGLIEYDRTNMDMKQRLHRVWDYEILVPKCVPPDYIVDVK